MGLALWAPWKKKLLLYRSMDLLIYWWLYLRSRCRCSRRERKRRQWLTPPTRTTWWVWLPWWSVACRLASPAFTLSGSWRAALRRCGWGTCSWASSARRSDFWECGGTTAAPWPSTASCSATPAWCGASSSTRRSAGCWWPWWWSTLTTSWRASPLPSPSSFPRWCPSTCLASTWTCCSPRGRGLSSAPSTCTASPRRPAASRAPTPPLPLRPLSRRGGPEAARWRRFCQSQSWWSDSVSLAPPGATFLSAPTNQWVSSSCCCVSSSSSCPPNLCSSSLPQSSFPGRQRHRLIPGGWAGRSWSAPCCSLCLKTLCYLKEAPYTDWVLLGSCWLVCLCGGGATCGLYGAFSSRLKP